MTGDPSSRKREVLDMSPHHPELYDVRLVDLLNLLFLSAIWGASFLFMRISAPDFGPVPLIAFRMTLAGLALAPVFFHEEARSSYCAHWWQLLISGVVGSALSFVLLSYATLTLSAGFTSLLNSSVPVFSAIIAAIWLKERLSGSQLIGIILGINGVFILVWDKIDFQKSGIGWPVLACVTACFCYGFGAAWMKRHLQNIKPLVASSGSLLGAGLVLIPFAFTQLPSEAPSALSWLSAIALSLICTALAFVFFFKLIQRTGATVASSVTFLIPFFGIFWGWLFLDESVTAQMIAGLLVSLTGMAMITKMIGYKASS